MGARSPKNSGGYRIDQPYAAGEASMLPASTAHSKRAPGSLAANANAADDDATVPLGPAEMAVSGGVVSTSHAACAGEASALPAASSARTWKACCPSARPE